MTPVPVYIPGTQKDGKSRKRVEGPASVLNARLHGESLELKVL